MTRILQRSLVVFLVLAAFGLVAVGARTQLPQAPAGPPQQPTDLTFTINGEGGAPPRLAVPEFIALTKDAETVAVAKIIAQVLYDDLNFEREFLLLPRDTYATIPAATSFTDVPFDRWRELNADGVLIGTVQKTGTGVHVEARLVSVRTKTCRSGNRTTDRAPIPGSTRTPSPTTCTTASGG